MKKITSILLYLLVGTSSTIAQENLNSEEAENQSISKVPCKAAELYQEQHKYYTNQPPSKAKKKFYKGAYISDSRIDPYSSSGNLFEAYYSASKSIPPATNCAGVDSAAWVRLGPHQPQNHDDLLQMGHISAVYASDTDPDKIWVGSNTNGIWHSTDGGAIWQNVTDYLGQPMLGITQIVASPHNSDIMLASSGTQFQSYITSIGTGILKSIDGGVTWIDEVSPEHSLINYGQVRDIEFNPNVAGEVYCITDKEVLKSTNYGSTWTQVTSAPVPPLHRFFYDISIADNGKMTVVAQGNYTAFYTLRIWNYNTGTDTWTNKTGSLNSGAVGLRIKLSNAVGNNVAVIYETSTLNNFNAVLSTDGGNTFGTPIQAAGSGAPTGKIEGPLWNKVDIELSKLDPEDFYMSALGVSTGNFSTGTIALTTGFPHSATVGTITSNTHGDVRAMYVVENPDSTNEILLVGCDGGLSISDDQGNTFQGANGIDLDNSQVFGIGFPYQPSFDNLIAGFMDNSNRVYDSSADEFEYLQGGDGAEVGMFPNGIYVTHDPQGGSNFLSFNFNAQLFLPQHSSFNSLLDDIHFASPIEVDVVNKRIFAGATDASGAAEIVVYNDAAPYEYVFPSQMTQIGAVGFCEADPEVIYAAEGLPNNDGHHLYKSTNGGVTFSNVSAALVDLTYGTGTDELGSLLEWKKIKDIAVSPSDPNHVWIAIDGLIREPWPTYAHELFRVLESTDGGISWTDVSEGLPGIPAMELEYLKGSNDLVFMGNDHGVYYRDASMSSWECFNEDLPTCIISDLQIDYCGKNLVMSSFGRGIWYSPIPESFFNNSALEISQDLTIAYESYHFQDIIVKSGAKLTVTGTLFMGDDTRITVEPGAELNLNGGTITKLDGCSETLWQGIYVEGDAAKSQLGADYALQGRLIINNGNIEHAKNAVSLFGLNEADEIDWSKTGGIIKATNATFTDNWRAVAFLSYENLLSGVEQDNVSFFTNCNFETNSTGYLKDNTAPYAFVTMHDVIGVNFYGSSFENLSVGNITERGQGIIAIDAEFEVKERCTIAVPPGTPCALANMDPSEFKNLSIGIDVQETAQPGKVWVDYVEFEDCGIGVNAGSRDNQIQRSTFLIATGSGDPASNYAEDNIGVQITTATDTRIEECSFIQSGSHTPGDGRSIGVFAVENNANTVAIYLNTFENLETQIQTEDNNDGLEIDCNNFTRSANTTSDIYFASGTLANQGICLPDMEAPVANTFTGACDGTTNEWQIFTAASLSFNYNSYDESFVGINSASCVDSDVIYTNCSNPTYIQEEACPSLIPVEEEEEEERRSPVTDTDVNQNDLLAYQSDRLKPLPYDLKSENNDLENTSIMRVSPNPFSSIVTISGQIEMPFETAQIVILDNLGRPVQEQQITNNGFNLTFDLSAQTDGIYMAILLVDGAQIEAEKLIKNK